MPLRYRRSRAAPIVPRLPSAPMNHHPAWLAVSATSRIASDPTSCGWYDEYNQCNVRRNLSETASQVYSHAPATAYESA